MDKKADAQHTPERLPLEDDPRWLPIETAFQRLTERTGDTALAILDLEQALAQDRLPFMARSTVTGERKRLVWTGKLMLWAGKDGLRVMHRPQPGERHVLSVRDFRFYIWEPHFNRIWPPHGGSAPVDHEEPLLPIDRAKAALLYLYPTKAQMPRLLKAATTAVDGYCQKQGWQLVSSPDTVHRAAEQLGYRAPRKRR
jgi:hypothetical protein